MIPRYSRPEMARLWSDENRFATWLEVELAATEVLVERGVVPEEALAAIKERARFDVARIEEIEKEVQHDVIAFVSCVAENVGPEGRWLHYGLTSSDVVDTALSMLMRDACDLVRAGPPRPHGGGAGAGLPAPARADDRAHPRRPRRADDLRAQAGPVARRAAAAARAARPRAGHDRRTASSPGAVGTFSHLPPDVEEAVLRAARACCPRPVSSQVLQRDRHAEVHDDARAHRAPASRSSRPRSAPCRRPRCARWRSRSARARRAPRPCPTSGTRSAASRSPASPGSCAANALAALENVALWHERDISHSSVERVIVPDSFLALDHMLRPLHPDREGHDGGRGAHAPQPRPRPRASCSPASCCSSSPRRGMRREDAYRVVQGHAMEAWKSEGDFRQRVLARPRDPRGSSARPRSTRCSGSSATSPTSTRSSRGCSGRLRPGRPEGGASDQVVRWACAGARSSGGPATRPAVVRRGRGPFP